MICCTLRHKTTKSLVFQAALDQRHHVGVKHVQFQGHFSCRKVENHQPQHFCRCFSSLQVATLSSWRSLEAKAAAAAADISLAFKCPQAVRQRAISLGWPSCRDSICPPVVHRGAPPPAGTTHMKTSMKDEQTVDDLPGQAVAWAPGNMQVGTEKKKRFWRAVLSLGVNGRRFAGIWTQVSLTCCKWKTGMKEHFKYCPPALFGRTIRLGMSPLAYERRDSHNG